MQISIIKICSTTDKLTSIFLVSFASRDNDAQVSWLGVSWGFGKPNVSNKKPTSKYKTNFKVCLKPHPSLKERTDEVIAPNRC
jgi:hypothetical protein